jgi:hypothetical protein
MRKVRICHCFPTNPFAVPFAKTPAVVLCWLLLTLPAPARLQAQTSHSTPSPPAHRCLIIVETSRVMQRRAPGAYAALKALLDSGLKGQLRRGDMISLWTFNEGLHTNQFEPWSPQTQLAYAVRLSAFRSAAAYEKRASLDKVLPQMERVIRESEFITVILVSSGEDLMRDTPFHDQINEAFIQWRDEQRKVRMPFVTLLRAWSGRFTDWSVTPAPWPVELPPLPAEPQIVVEDDSAKPAEAPAPERSATPLPVILAAKTEPVVQIKPPGLAAPKPDLGVVDGSGPAIPRLESSADARNGGGLVQTTAPVLASTPQPTVKKNIPSPVAAPVEPVSLPVSDRAPVTQTPGSSDPVTIRAETQKTGPVAPQPASAREMESAPAVAPALAQALAAERRPPQPRQPAAESRDEKDKPVETPPGPQGFIRENAVWLAIGTVSGIAAVYLLLTWRLIYVRPRAGPVSSPQPRKGEETPPPKV